MPTGPLDFFDTLASTDWHGRFAPFTTPQLRQLRRYHELAHELGRSSFFSQRLTFSVKASPEERYQRLEHAGHDALRSMSMSFRQLWDASEPARFDAVRQLLRGNARPPRDQVDVRVLLDVLGSRFKAATRSDMMRIVWQDDRLGEPKEVIRARQVIDDWLYSGPFHADEDRIARVGRWSSTAYEFTLAKALHAIAGVIWELQIVVGGALGPRHDEADCLAANG
jgi:hypothetical protein